MGQVLHIVRLQGVLVERIAASAADAQILRRLQKGRGHGQPVHLGAQAVDDFRDADFALIERLERDVDKSAIAAAATAADVGIDIGHRRVRLDDIDQGFDRSVHHREGCVLRPCTPPTIAPVSCWGKKPFGILTISTTFRAMVSNSTTSIKPELSSTHDKEWR